ncbi:LamG-like jellyroll fold domain-containing protein [Flavobacterium sp.]|jgi:hypothetical protein|uniref:LamG-like jellyroll fold domain-containing protein n=1 Tax=Flavobacterium sp. TaxID=239 RepID=UPI0037BF32BB
MNVKNYFSMLFCFCASFIFAQPPGYVPSSGLLAWWGMADATDATTNGNTLTANSLTPTTDRFGNANSAYSFNGTSSYLTRTSFGNTFTQSGSFSVSIWVKKSNNTAGVSIMSGSTASLNFIWLVQCDATKAIFGTNKQQSSWFWTNATTNYVLNQWEHYVGVYSGNTMTFYRNGVLQGTTTNTHTSVSQAVLPLWIGRGVSGDYFAGSLDDIGIWNRAITPNEVAILYQSTLGLNDISASKVIIFPNPTTSMLQLEVDAQNIGKTYQIIDELGRTVSTQTITATSSEVSVAALKTGLYFLKIEGVTPVKFIKN